ncbi:hypothetical protein BB558_005485 [Smittium angustum]|uniref:HpcH/HpaI aldolase/citrate lyase domain-containing protein n=1 Tax=Smittium angustum TaxID=133377 RepID=A0A2U1J0C4_SMIAN|nr:hypothetical protein BB558_005485 [Smittium angustum]
MSALLIQRRLVNPRTFLPRSLGLPSLFVKSYSSEVNLRENKRIRRSLLYVPCSEERKIQKSLKTKADCVIYDLEDGVSMNRKGQARNLVSNALALEREHKPDLGVRINSIGSGLELDDLQVILQSKNLKTILIPKVQSSNDINIVSNMIDTIAPKENQGEIRIIAAIESALGIMNIKEISTCNPRVDSLLFASEDYCSDVEITRTPSRTELYFARSSVATAAHAYGLDAIDMVCMDFNSPETLVEESLEAVRMGFSGKQAIHPNQVDIIHECFCPNEQTLDRAIRIIKGFEEYSSAGIGAFALDGKAIDIPVVKWAQKVVARAKLGGVDVDSLLAAKTK